MNKNWLIGLGIAGAVLIYVLQRKSQVAKSVQFSFDKLNVSLKNKTINFVLGILNPASGSVMVKSVVGQLVFNDKTIASVETFQPITIEGNKKTQINLLIKPSGVGILQLIVDFIKIKKAGQKQSANVTFTGYANVDGVTMPINSELVNV